MPKISVIIPSYNHAAYIGEAVHSVLTQSEGDLDLIVVDDGSTDSSLKVLERFTDHRLRVIAQTNQGAHAAINRGLQAASGNYLAILNSDDVYHPQRLEKLTGLLKNSNHKTTFNYSTIINFSIQLFVVLLTKGKTYEKTSNLVSFAFDTIPGISPNTY